MLISMAHAAGDAVAVTPPTTADTFWMNMGLIGVMFILFYVLMIRPQQRRLKEQRDMLDTLQKGDSIVTSGGLVGTVSKVISDKEVEIDLGMTKVVALRYTIQMKMDGAAVLPTAKVETKTKPAKAVAKKSTVKKSTKK